MHSTFTQHSTGIKTALFATLLLLTLHNTISAQHYSMSYNPLQAYQCDGLYGNGISFYDFNNDGFDDITLLFESQAPVFLQNNQGTFAEVSFPGIDLTGRSRSICWVDFNEDGFPDLSFFGSNQGIRLYLNNGDFSFTDITTVSGIEQLDCTGYAQAWADYDLDGDLDVYFSNYESETSPAYCANKLYRNNGDNTFTELATQLGLDNGLQMTFVSVWTDFDGDHDMDLYVTNDRLQFFNYLYRNNGDGTFSDVSVESGLFEAFEPMSGTIGDINQDGLPDFYVTDNTNNRLYQSNGDGTYTDVAGMMNLQMHKPCWGAAFTDADLDGKQDLIVATATLAALHEHLFFFRNTGFTFESNLGVGFGNQLGDTYAIALGDVNNDGKQDIACHNQDSTGSILYTNQFETGNHLKIKLQGTTSNRDGIGSRIKVCSNNNIQYLFMQCGDQYLSQNSQWLIAGIGDAFKADSVIVDWPGGAQDVYYDLAAGHRHLLQQGMGGAPLVVQYSGAATPCNGDTIALSIEPNGAAIWSNGQSDSSIFLTQNDTLLVWLNNGQYTQVSDSIMLQFLEAPDYNLNLIMPPCAGMGGSIAAIENYPQITTVLVDSQLQILPISNLSPGIYEVSISQAGQCDVRREITITEPEPLQAQILIYIQDSGINCPNGITGSALVNGGTEPYSYQWNLIPISGSSPFSGFTEESFPCTPLAEPTTVQLLLSDANGCELLEEQNVHPTKTTHAQAQRALVYPNPFSQSIHLKNSGYKKAEVFDQFGRLVYSKNLSPYTKQLELSHLKKGKYHLKLSSKTSVVRSPIVKIE